MRGAPATARQVVLARRPAGTPRPEDLRIEEITLPPLGDGQVLLETAWLSVDPLLAIHTSERPLGGAFPPLPIGAMLPGGGVSRVVASRAPALPVGAWVEGRTGWCTASVVSADTVRPIDLRYQKEALGVLGLSGYSAWGGLQLMGDIAGKTILISGASGAVGGVAGQLAKAAGARAIGLAGGPAKCAYLVDELGFEQAIDHRAGDFADQIRGIEGTVDFYFDNVGSELLLAILPALARGGTIVVCGLMGHYERDGAGGSSGGPSMDLLLKRAMSHQIRLVGFSNREFDARRAEFDAYAQSLIAAGKLTERYDVKSGLNGAITHLADMFTTDAIGKRLAQLDPAAPD